MYKKHEKKFSSVNFTSKQIWEIIAKEMQSELSQNGHDRFPTYKQCNNRWNTMNKAYRATIDHNRKSGADRRTCYYFTDLDELNSERPNVNPVAIASSSRPHWSQNVKNVEEIQNESDEDNDEEKASDSESESEEQQATSSNTQTTKTPKAKPKRKRKYTSTATENTKAILMWLNTYEQKKEERERLQMEKMEKWHEQKMTLFEKLIDKL